MTDRHILITNGRSGSNYFVQMLNQHPQVVNYGEVLGEWTLPGRHILPRFRRSGAEGYLEWLYASRGFFEVAQIYSLNKRKRRGRAPHFRRWSEVKTIGIKEMMVNLRRHEVLDSLIADEALKVITLVRENPLDRYVSGALMRETGVIVRTAATPVRSATIRLDIQKTMRALETIEEENDAVRGIADKIAPSRVFSLTYEGYFNTDEARRREIESAMLTFLGVEQAALQSEHRRIRQGGLPSVVENYEEIARALAETRFAKYL